MKSAKLFLFGMYFHLLISITAAVGILYLCKDGWNTAGIGLLFFYLAIVVMIQIFGWICAGSAVAAYRLNRIQQLRDSLKLLKLYSIPFYLLNFIYNFFVWVLLVGASRGIFIVFVPIPILITYLMIIQSGCVGICYIMYLRRYPVNRRKPSAIHYILQAVFVLDVFSTIYLLRSYPIESYLATDIFSAE